ncbi:hypothetical protein [Actinoplanes solisilvae]|uniref:hypothetical protein n=1 Tax=Actinoplanes solisilvae TaxID=2486853 RepID=UPI000FDB58C9|nr:hypothetical protein [Actinoplanes solisilvae]
MIDNLVVRARTALSPEWDHGFDEAFAELVSSDPDLVQAEFDDLIAASWPDPPEPARPPDPPTRSTPSPGTAALDQTSARPKEETTDDIIDHQRPPP